MKTVGLTTKSAKTTKSEQERRQPGRAGSFLFVFARFVVRKFSQK
jgi:hypothetical protein